MPERNEISGPSLWLVWWKATHAIERRDRESIRAQGFENLSDFAVLEAILHKGPLPVNAIGRKVLLTSGSITAAVDRAEKKGLVRRQATPTDRRVVEVHLTDTGRALIERAYAEHAHTLDELFSVLSATERQTLYRLVKKAGLHAEEVQA